MNHTVQIRATPLNSERDTDAGNSPDAFDVLVEAPPACRYAVHFHDEVPTLQAGFLRG